MADRCAECGAPLLTPGQQNRGLCNACHIDREIDVRRKADKHVEVLISKAVRLDQIRSYLWGLADVNLSEDARGIKARLLDLTQTKANK